MLYPPKGTLPVTLCGQELWLLPSRALLWPRLRLMVLAGLHIGVNAGQDAVQDDGGVGARTAPADVQRLLQLVKRLQPQRLVALGPSLRGREQDPTGTGASELVAWFRKAFSGQLDVVRSDLEHDTSSLQQHAGRRHQPWWTTDVHPSQWTNELRIGPFYFRERCQHAEPATTQGTPFVIAAQRGEGRPGASHTTDHPQFCLLEDCLLLPPFSDAAPHAHGAVCRGQRAPIANGNVAWAA